jgi:cysteine desulfurase
VIQWVNHETGTCLPVAEYAQVCAAQGVPLVVDACQALGKIPLDVRDLGASVVVVAASKIGGPAGASALWHERCRPLSPVAQGGGQERGLRPGTPDLAALAGFGQAVMGLPDRLASMPRLARLRDALEQACVALGAKVNGAEAARVATVTNLSFPGWRGEVLVAALDVEGVCASSGAACSSGLNAPSPVLRSMYPDEPWRAESALRLSLGPETTEREIHDTVAVLGRVLARSQSGRGA